VNKLPPNIHTGDTVTILAEGRTLEAAVVIASPNSVSLLLSFEAILHGHVGMMPVLWDNDEYVTLDGDKVEVSQPS
jgi:L-rhamnose isomerase